MIVKQYTPSSAERGILSREFAKRAHPGSDWFKRLLFWIATVDYELMRRDVKRVAEWDFQRIIPCHGEVVEETGKEAWIETHRWFLESDARPGLFRRAVHRPFMKIVRWFFLM